MARSVNDRLQDETIAHGLYVNRYGTGVARRMVALLNRMDADLAAKLLVLLDGKIFASACNSTLVPGKGASWRSASGSASGEPERDRPENAPMPTPIEARVAADPPFNIGEP